MFVLLAVILFFGTVAVAIGVVEIMFRHIEEHE